MKLDLDEFLPKLALVKTVISSKPVIPITGCFLLHTEADGLLHVNATDTENTMSVSIEPVEFSEIRVCVNADDFYSALLNLKGEQVDIVVNEEKKLIRCSYKSGYFQLPYDDDKNASSTLEIQQDSYLIDKDIDDTVLLSEAIGKVEIAASDDGLKPILCGVYFDFKQDGLVVVATDTFKISKFKTDITFDSDMQGFILPNKCASILVSLLREIDTVNMKVGTHSALFKGGDYTFRTRLTEGAYPNYDMIIPTDNTYTINISRNTVINAIKRVVPMENIDNGLLVLNFDKDTFIIEAEDIAFKKKAKEKIDISYSGEPMKIGINSRNLLSLLQVIDSEDIEISFKGARMPVVLQPKTDIKQYIAIVMPMTLN